MESAISSLILFSLGIFAALTLSHTYLETQDRLWRSEMEGRTRMLTQARTDLALVTTATQSSGNEVEVTLRNTGQVKLADFDRWDVVVQYYSEEIPSNDPALYNYQVRWLPYVAHSPGDLEWTVAGLYMDATAATPEVFEPGILNPGEEIKLLVKLRPFAAKNVTHQILVSTPNGVQVSGFFEH